APSGADRPLEERQGCSQVTRLRQPAIEHLAVQADAAVQGVPPPQDLHVRLIHKPRRAHWLPVPTDLRRQSWPELLDPAQNGPSADVDASVGEEARDAFGGGAQL